MESPALGLPLLGLLAVAALILANAYFVATEFALVAVRRSQIKLWVAEGRRGAGAVAMALTRLDDAIAATQLGITLASLGLGWVGEPALARLIEPMLASVGIGSAVAVHGVAVALAFSLITFLHVVVGELAPKALALDHPGPVALACARPLLLFGRTFRWAIWLMNSAGNALVRLLGVRPTREAAHGPLARGALAAGLGGARGRRDPPLRRPDPGQRLPRLADPGARRDDPARAGLRDRAADRPGRAARRAARVRLHAHPGLRRRAGPHRRDPAHQGSVPRLRGEERGDPGATRSGRRSTSARTCR